MESVSQLVWLYVKQRPFLKEVLRQGVVNHSALARRISAEAFGGAKQDAIKMALIRLSGKMDRLESDLEGKILAVLRKSSMVVKSKVAALRVRPVVLVLEGDVPARDAALRVDLLRRQDRRVPDVRPVRL